MHGQQNIKSNVHVKTYDLSWRRNKLWNKTNYTRILLC